MMGGAGGPPGGMPDIGAMMKAMGGAGGPPGGMPDIGAMMKAIGPMMGGPPQNAQPAAEAQKPAPPKVGPTADQKCAGQMLALKDSVNKLSGIDFPAIKHSEERPSNEVCASHLLDLTQSTQIMLSYMQRSAELLRRGEMLTDAEREELTRLQKLVNDSMEQLSRGLFHVSIQFKNVKVPEAKQASQVAQKQTQ